MSSVTDVRVAEGPVAEEPVAERSDGEVSFTVETESVFRAGVPSGVAAGELSDFEVTGGRCASVSRLAPVCGLV